MKHPIFNVLGIFLVFCLVGPVAWGQNVVDPFKDWSHVYFIKRPKMGLVKVYEIKEKLEIKRDAINGDEVARNMANQLINSEDSKGGWLFLVVKLNGKLKTQTIPLDEEGADSLDRSLRSTVNPVEIVFPRNE